MPRVYPSYDALRLADRVLIEVARRAQGFEGRVGAAWYWRLPGGILATFWLQATVTEERWDVLHAEASTMRASSFSSASFPFAAYATSATSPPYIHDLKGVAEWANRLYLQMGHLIEDAAHWLNILHAVAIAPAINPAAAFPALSHLERRIVAYALDELDGYFTIKTLYPVFRGEISRARLSQLAREWEAAELLTERPRRVTYALQALAENVRPRLCDQSGGHDTGTQPGTRSIGAER
ncbi:MAG: hypothetical protein GX620_10550 [Chloroflexi bacterium]|nr:hypothetical protein [Chloroflexota bacterium]